MDNEEELRINKKILLRAGDVAPLALPSGVPPPPSFVLARGWRYPLSWPGGRKYQMSWLGGGGTPCRGQERWVGGYPQSWLGEGWRVPPVLTGGGAEPPLSWSGIHPGQGWGTSCPGQGDRWIPHFQAGGTPYPTWWTDKQTENITFPSFGCGR